MIDGLTSEAEIQIPGQRKGFKVNSADGSKWHLILGDRPIAVLYVARA